MASDYSIKLSIVIPVYGSELVLPELVSQLIEVLNGLADINGSYEIIFVCDRSPDRSWQVIQAISEKYPQILRGVLLRMNAGQHNALMAGFALAKGEVIVTMDDALQHSPSDIPKLLHEINDG